MKISIETLNFTDSCNLLQAVFYYQYISLFFEQVIMARYLIGFWLIATAVCQLQFNPLEMKAFIDQQMQQQLQQTVPCYMSCGPGTRCENGRCVQHNLTPAAINTPPECGKDCPPAYCVLGKCILPFPTNANGTRQTTQTITLNAQPTTLPAPFNGSAASKASTCNVHCSLYFHCENNKCAPDPTPTGCFVTCVAGYQCEKGQCRPGKSLPAPIGCKVACTRGFYCDRGQCVPDNTSGLVQCPFPCPIGFRCEGGLCKPDNSKNIKTSK